MTRISYAEAAQRAANEVLHSINCRYFVTVLLADCDCGSATQSLALIELARICDRAIANEATYLDVANRGASEEVVRHGRERREIVADLAAGFTVIEPPAEAAE